MTASMRTAMALAASVIAVLAVPSVAFAHVGKSPPVATDFLAHITRTVDGIKAKVVDGDQTLWLSAGDQTVAIRGIEGEPLLRFDGHGVWLNLRSLTAQTDQIDRFDLRPDPNPHAPPLWHKVSGGHSYMWHEHRLHLLEPLAHGRNRPATLGPWMIPLVVDGHGESLSGVLDYQPPPSALAWIGITVILAAAGALAAWRSRRTTIVLALTAVPIVWTLRIARELYGRPTVGAVGWIEMALTSLIGLALLYGLLRAEPGLRVFVAFLTAFGALYQGLTMYPILTHAVALTVLPTTAARIGATLTLALAAATVIGSWNAVLHDRHADQPDDQHLITERRAATQP